MTKQPIYRLGLALVLLLGAAGVSSGQSAFPVRFDGEPLTGAMNVTTAAAVVTETGRNYSKSFTYEVDLMNPSVNVLDVIATTDDTVVVIRVLAASSRSDVTNSGALRERVIRAKWDADAGAGGQWSEILGGDTLDLNANAQISISTNVAGSGPLELVVNGGVSQDLMTVVLEVVASQDVTFAEFTAST